MGLFSLTSVSQTEGRGPVIGPSAGLNGSSIWRDLLGQMNCWPVSPDVFYSTLSSPFIFSSVLLPLVFSLSSTLTVIVLLKKKKKSDYCNLVHLMNTNAALTLSTGSHVEDFTLNVFSVALKGPVFKCSIFLNIINTYKSYLMEIMLN